MPAVIAPSPVADPIQLVLNLADQASPILNAIANRIQAAIAQFAEFGKAGDKGFGDADKSAQKLNLSVQDLAKGFATAQVALRLLEEAGRRSFDLLIGQNIELRQQVQSTAAQLVSKQDVLVGGKLVTDTLQAIQIAQKPVQEQIEQLRQDATKLSGVTSNDLVPSFQAMANASGALRLDLNQSRELTVGLTAQAITLGLSASQAQFYVQQIATGTIDPTYNTLAKSIGLNNERLRQLAAEGKLYDYIQQKTQAGLKGQELIAKSWSGVTSNIQEYVQLLAQSAGAPILDALLVQLSKIEQFLKPDNPAFGGIKAFADDIGRQLGNLFNTIGNTIEAVATQFQEGFGSEGWDAIKEGLTTAIDGFSLLFRTVQGNASVFKTIGEALAGGLELFNEGVVALRGMFAQIVSNYRSAFLQIAKLYENIPILGAKAKEIRQALEGWEDPIQGAAEASKTLKTSTEQTLTASATLMAKINAHAATGKDLTQEQLAANQKLKDQAKNQLSDIEARIAAERAFAPMNAEQAAQKRDAIKQLEQQRDAIARVTKELKGTNDEAGKVTFQNQTLKDQGTLYDLLAAREKSARQSFEKPLDLNQLNESAKTLTSTIEQEATLGKISAAEARKQLTAIANDRRTDAATRQQNIQAAEQSISKIEQAELNRRKQTTDAHVAATEARVRSGQLSEIDGLKEISKLKQAEFQFQLQQLDGQIQAEQAAIDKGYGSKNKLDELKAKAESVRAQQRTQEIDAQEKLEQKRLEILERSQRKALDAVKFAETQRDIETQKLLNAHQIREVEANERNLKEKQKVNAKELELEQQKLKTLEALPALSDPAKEADRQAKIRSSRQRTADLTMQMLKDSYQLEEAHTRVVQDRIDQQLKKTLNAYTQEQQALEQLNQGLDFKAKAIERQNTLLSAQKELQNAISSYVNGQYQLAESLTTSEYRKRKIQEEAARARLAFLAREQALERQSLELEIAKNKALLEREKIQNKIEQSKSKAEVAQAEAELAKTQADKKATPQEIEAKQLAVQAARDKQVGVEYQGLLLDEQGKQQDGLDSARRKGLKYKQELQYDQARADVAKATRTKSDDRALAREFLDKARNAQDDPIDVNVPKSNLPSYEQFYAAQRGQSQRPPNAVIQQQINQATGQNGSNSSQIQPVQAQLGRNAQAVAGSDPQIVQLLTEINKAVLAGFAEKEPRSVTLNNTITNQFSGADVSTGAAGESVKQQVLNGLYDVARLAKAKGNSN